MPTDTFLGQLRLAALVLGGVAAAEGQRQAKQAEADQAYVQVDALVKAMRDPAVDPIWAQARRDWETLRAGVANKTLGVPQSFAAHGALIPQLLKLNDRVGDHFGLSLDPDRDSYQLIQSMYYQLPYLTEELGRTRALGAGLLAKKSATAEERNLAWPRRNATSPACCPTSLIAQPLWNPRQFAKLIRYAL